MTIEEKIKRQFAIHKELSVKELVNRLDVSKQMIHKVLNKLVETGIVEKLGATPKTVYRRLENRKNKEVPTKLNITEEQKDFLQKHFLIVTATGNLIEGAKAFEYWCNERKQPLQKTLLEFILTKQKYLGYYNENGIIKGTQKLIKTYQESTYLDDIYYIDFYAIERFGKTKLGTLLHYAKQGQNKFLMSKVMEEVQGKVMEFISIYQIDAVGFVPPTIRREVQIMKYIQDRLNVPLPVLDIKKINGLIPVPQKSLSKLDERIKNAESTFAITDQRKFNRVLLLDDAVGSGSTLNQIAEKIKSKQIAKEVIGLAVVGSFKGFDVITDI